MGQTVNLLVNAYGGSNPSVPTIFYYLESCLQEDSASGSSSFGRAIAFQAIGGGFEPRLPLETKKMLLREKSLLAIFLFWLIERD